METTTLALQWHSLNQGLNNVAEEVRFSLYQKGITCCDATKEVPTHLGGLAHPCLCSLVAFNDGTSPQILRECIETERKESGKHVIAVNLNDRPIDLHLTWDLLNMGANEVLNWRSVANPSQIVRRRLERWQYVDRLLDSPKIKLNLIGRNAFWKSVLSNAIEVAIFSQASVLILGESGTGKEGIARLIHDLDRRPFKEELVLLDCASVVPELSGSEFFGHEKGAFTNAINTRDGAFALADKGSLFLDEIGELPLNLQAELLRVIQEGTYKRVGSNTWKQTNFRLIGATNRNLQKEIKRKHFREDLFYRISTWTLTLPPLRERREDIPDLVRHFLKQLLKTDKIPDIEPAVMTYLETRDYKGNIRELRQLVARMLVRHVGDTPITVGDIPERDLPKANFTSAPLSMPAFKNSIHTALKGGSCLKDIVSDVSNIAKDLAIQDANGNLQLAAQTLNVTDRTLQAHQAARRLPVSV